MTFSLLPTCLNIQRLLESHLLFSSACLPFSPLGKRGDFPPLETAPYSPFLVGTRDTGLANHVTSSLCPW